MDKLIDFTNCEHVHRKYGGSDRKFGVRFGNDVYMIKFSQKHAKRSEISTSYVNNVVSEYISSHICQSAGLPTHETVLGFYNKEIVVGCKDFRKNKDSQIIEFAEYIRARYESGDIKRFVNLDQFYQTLKDPNNAIPEELQQKSIERFWETFVIDALVGNFDRHYENWGFLLENEILDLTPIYDFGSSLLPRLSDLGAMEIYENEFEELKRVFLFPSPQLVITDEKTGRVGYYDMMTSNYDPELTKAIIKIVPRIDLEKINNIIDNTPLITAERKNFYKRMLKIRKELILDKAYECCINNSFDKEAQERIKCGRQFSEDDLKKFIKENIKLDVFDKNQNDSIQNNITLTDEEIR